MGRMKEFCIDLINANGGIPEGITIADVVRMKELDMYNWEEYERQQERIRLQQLESKNSGKIAEVVKAKQTRGNTKFEEENQEPEIY
jgi:hypothetical protein